MIPAGTNRILTINSGSSSLKLALYEIGRQENLIFAANVNRIGKAVGHIRMTDVGAQHGVITQRSCRNHNEALRVALQLLEEKRLDEQIDATCHRIVHGGARHNAPQLITAQLIGELRELVPIDPDHLPQAIKNIEMVGRKYPDIPQIACFDTAFHRNMPRVAQLCPLPTRYFDEGILRYGFHGISYEYIMSELLVLDRGLADGRVVVAHLGNGASMAAIKGGHSLDTTMGFTPTSGLVMGTRSGDIDPGVLLYLLGRGNMTAERISSLINKQAGLLGVSEMSEDMEDLLAKEETNPRAADAIALFCYRARKYLAAYVAVLGGLDVLVFTAGIGEHAPTIRERICSGLEILGILIDPARNRLNASVISSDHSRVTVRVMKTDENLMLARHAVDVLMKAAESERSR
jgi:acetate kinase